VRFFSSLPPFSLAQIPDPTQLNFCFFFFDRYYEGKEFEVRVKEKKPGSLSEDLKVCPLFFLWKVRSNTTELNAIYLQTALSIPPGAPPPWLINMQRYGPPPSYPNMKIPGLNCPIPET